MMKRRNHALAMAANGLLIGSMMLGCASESDPEQLQRPPNLPASGEQYVVDQILLGADYAEVQSYGFDFDGDDRPDNNLGSSIRVAYSAFGRESQADLDAAVASGEMMHLLMFGEPDEEYLDTARLFLGTDTDADPDNNFSGDAELAIRPSTRLDGAVFGDATGQERRFAGGSVILENTLFGAVTLPLSDARLRATVNDDGSIIGAVGGVIVEDDLENELKPAIISSLLDDIARDCTDAVPPACCESGTRGADWMALFDGDEDCQLIAADIRNSSLFQALLAPDIDLDDRFLSVGFGFTAVPAQFTVPR